MATDMAMEIKVSNFFSSLFVSSREINQEICVDIHSHLIPGIDDGSKRMEDSISMILSLKSLGYKKLIITPHIKSDQFPNSIEIIKDGFFKLVGELLERGIDMEIEVGAEYFVDEHFYALLRAKDILTFGKNYLLFEFSYYTPPRDLRNLIHEIKLAGYIPVLAHPERYAYFHDDFSKYEELKEWGVLFQININSISGYYSKAPQTIVKKLIKNSMVDFVGSDTHHKRHIKALEEGLKSSLYRQIFKKNSILNNNL